MARIGTHQDWIKATAQVAGCVVVGRPNVGDAAAPITRHAGDHIRSLGQEADYRHCYSTEDAAATGAGAIVETWWDGQGWSHHVESVGLDLDHQEIVAEVRRRVEARAKAERNAMAAAEAASREAIYRQGQRMAGLEAPLVQRTLQALGITPAEAARGIQVLVQWWGHDCHVLVSDRPRGAARERDRKIVYRHDSGLREIAS